MIAHFNLLFLEKFLYSRIMKLESTFYGSAANSIVILHGLLGASTNWTTIAKRLGEEYSVIVPSLRNHGNSPHGSHSIELMRNDVYELLEGEEVEKTLLIGHSMGGMAAMSFALAYPEKLMGLIIIDITPQAGSSQMSLIFDNLLGLELNKIKNKDDADAKLSESINDKAVRQFLLQNLKQKQGNYFWRCNLEELNSFIRDKNTYILDSNRQYSGPVLFIGGGKSDYRIDQKEALIKNHFPNYKLEMIPDAGHWVHFEARESFLEMVEKFITTYC